MISISYAFHVGSLIASIFLVFALIRVTRQKKLMSEISNGSIDRIYVGNALDVIQTFADAYGIPFTGVLLVKPSIAKIRLRSLLQLHTHYGISEITASNQSAVVVNFKISRFSATIEQNQKQIESDFANSVQVRVIGPSPAE